MQALPEQPVQASSASKRPPGPPPPQAQTEQSTQGTSKGKQTVRPPPEQPVQANPTSEKSRQLPLRLSTQTDSEATQSTPKQPAQPESKGKQPLEPPVKEQAQDDHKGKQPMRKPLLPIPECIIARIPVDRDAPIKRVRLFIMCEVGRHPQTFFFKNLPETGPYWGCENYKASTATRIVRLVVDGVPSHYFLLVCRGEHPKVTSPRNCNAVFGDIHVPVFNDAFVFKLGDPEINENGWARFVNIEANIGSVEWLPGAVREAASLVDNAEPKHANPGFPNLEDYADEETRKMDAESLDRWKRDIAKAERKAGSGYPVYRLPQLTDLERMHAIMIKRLRKVTSWIWFQSEEEGSEFGVSSDTLFNTTCWALCAIENSAADVHAIRQGTSDDKAIEAIDRIKTTFQEAWESFVKVKGLVNANVANEAREILASDGEPRKKLLLAYLDHTMMMYDVWKEKEKLKLADKA